MKDFEQNDEKLSLIPRMMQFMPTNLGGTPDFSPTTAKGLSSFIGGKGLVGATILRPIALASFLAAPGIDAFIKGYRWRKKALNPEGKQLSIHQSVYEADPQEPASKTDKKNPSTVAGTSTTVNPTSEQSPGTIKPGGAGVNKPKTPKGPKGPKAAKIPETEKQKLDARQKELTSQQQPSPEELQRQRVSANAQQIYSRLSSKFGISGTGGQAKPPVTRAGGPTSAGKPQSAKESFRSVLQSKLMEARVPKKRKFQVPDHYGTEHYPELQRVADTARKRKRSTAKALKSFLQSTADLTLHRGVSKYPFRSDDRQHFYTGRPLSMRNKLMAQHKRGQLKLPPGFGNFSPAQVGAHFDDMTDQGMLEPGRAQLDPSNVNYFMRKAKRVTKRTVGKVKNFLGDIVSRFRKKESEQSEKSSLVEAEVKDTCRFMSGDVSYPDQCDCIVCKATVDELLRESEELSETAFTSMPQLGRSEPAAALPDRTSPMKEDVIVRLLKAAAKRRERNAPRFKKNAASVAGGL